MEEDEQHMVYRRNVVLKNFKMAEVVAILDIGIEILATLIFNVILMPPTKLWFREEIPTYG